MSKLNQKFRVEINEEEFLNSYTTIDYLYRLKEYAINTFEWLNLPSTVDARYIELQLFEQGRICFFKDKLIGYLALPVNEEGTQNVYDEFRNKRIYANNGFHRNRNLENSVVIYNNFLRIPTYTTVNLYAIRLARVMRTIELNVEAQKTPILITCPENQKLALENVYKKYKGNSPVIYTDSEFNLDSIKVLKTDAPYVADKLTDYKHDLWNEVMTFLGVNNANQDKRERLVADEVGANDEQIEQARYNMLDARKEACRKINDMFGLNIDVKFRNDKVQKAYEQYKVYEMFPELKPEAGDEIEEAINNE